MTRTRVRRPLAAFFFFFKSQYFRRALSPFQIAEADRRAGRKKRRLLQGIHSLYRRDLELLSSPPSVNSVADDLLCRVHASGTARTTPRVSDENTVMQSSRVAGLKHGGTLESTVTGPEGLQRGRVQFCIDQSIKLYLYGTFHALKCITECFI